jgi:hypothetical protein
MSDKDSLKSRSRLSDIKSSRDLLPFLRASVIEDVSLYWLSVRGFPIESRQKQWILAFLENLKDELKKDKQVVETFLQLKYTRTDLNERFTNSLFEYRPMTGILIAPDGQLPKELTSLEAKRLTESHAADGTINLDHLVPDYCAWFAGSQDSNQRDDFFGVGGMLMIWIDEGQEHAPFQFDIPRVIRTHPAMKDVDLEGQMRRGMRLQHPFLKRSREIFAAHLPDGPVRRHALFVLPRLRSHHFIEATPETRKKWFEIFSAYCIESEADKGIVLALKDPSFDERLIGIIQAMREKDQEYPA